MALQSNDKIFFGSQLISAASNQSSKNPLPLYEYGYKGLLSTTEYAQLSMSDLGQTWSMSLPVYAKEYAQQKSQESITEIEFKKTLAFLAEIAKNYLNPENSKQFINETLTKQQPVINLKEIQDTLTNLKCNELTAISTTAPDQFDKSIYYEAEREIENLYRAEIMNSTKATVQGIICEKYPDEFQQILKSYENYMGLTYQSDHQKAKMQLAEQHSNEVAELMKHQYDERKSGVLEQKSTERNNHIGTLRNAIASKDPNTIKTRALEGLKVTSVIDSCVEQTANQLTVSPLYNETPANKIHP